MTQAMTYTLNVYAIARRQTMPRVAVEDNSRISLRIHAEEKALLLRAVALQRTDLTDLWFAMPLRPPRM
jgi:hypothetical protein